MIQDYPVHRRTLQALLALSLCLPLLAGCAGVETVFYQNKRTQAIQRDTVTASGLRTFVQNPENAVNGTVKLAPIESLNLQPTPISAPGLTVSPFDQPRALMVPPGFAVSVYAHGLGSPSDLVLREDGTLFYSDMGGGTIGAVASDGTPTVIASGLSSPHGMDISNGMLYYTDETRVFRFNFSSPTAVTGNSTLLTDKLADGSINEARAIRWVPGDKLLYVAVGASSDHSLEEDNSHAVVLRMKDQPGELPAAAIRGLRGTLAMDVHPETGELWGVDNGTDDLSLDLPPEEINILKIGRHYGWPYFYSQNFWDPRYVEDSAKFLRTIGRVTVPIIELEGHFDATDMQFYPGSALGADWKNSMIIACNGEKAFFASPEGVRVLRVRAHTDGSNARQADFITGFQDAEGKIWGRPSGVAIARDGKTFYISDSQNGVIYRIVKQ